MRTRSKTGRRAALVGGLVAAIAAAPAVARLEAGAGRAEVGLTEAMLPLDDFTAVHDPLQARVLLLADGPARVAVAVVDETSLMGDVITELQAAVSQATRTRPADVLVIASHTFSAPHMFGAGHLPPGMAMTADQEARAAAYHQAVVTAVSHAAEAASRGLKPARLRFGDGVADVNVNRNVPMADGWWLGANDAEYSDKALGLLRVDGLDGVPISFLASYAVQSAVMDHSVGAGGGKGVTADLFGAAAGHVEGRYGNGAVALFVTGAAGDQLPGYTARTNRYDKDGHFKTVDIGDAGYGLLGPQGGRLGEAAVRAAETAAPTGELRALRVVRGEASLDQQLRPRDLQQIKPTRSHPFQVSGKAVAPFYVLQIGDTAVVGVQVELSAATGAYIRAHSPFAHTLVATMVNGAAKYMPDADSYRKITYEAMNSSYGPGSAEIFADRILDTLKATHASAAR